MFFKQFEKDFIADEIKHNITVGVFDGIDVCAAAAVDSAERFIIILGGFNRSNRGDFYFLILAAEAFEQDFAFFFINVDAV